MKFDQPKCGGIEHDKLSISCMKGDGNSRKNQIEPLENSFLCSGAADVDEHKIVDFAHIVSIEAGHDQCLFWILTEYWNKQYESFADDWEKVGIEHESFLIIAVNQFLRLDLQVGGVQFDYLQKG